MTRVISIVSGKGGVGKTTLVSNLSFVLTELGKDVTAVDANLTTPHLGLHLGFYSPPKSLHDFLKADAKLQDIIYYHPYGFKIIPASLSIHNLTGANIDKLQDLILKLLGKTEFILVDSAPSLGKEALVSLEISDEILLLTNPNLPSVLDALKVAKIAEKLDKIILGVVVNRTNRKSNELSSAEVEEITNYPVINEIPEDINVSHALTTKTIVVDYNPKSPAATEIRALGHYLVGKEFKYPKDNFFQKIFSWFK